MNEKLNKIKHRQTWSPNKVAINLQIHHFDWPQIRSTELDFIADYCKTLNALL